MFHPLGDIVKLTLKTIVQPVCAYGSISGDASKWLPNHAEGAGSQNDDSLHFCAEEIQMVYSVCGWRLEDGDGGNQRRRATQLDVFIQIETASRAE